MRLDLCESGISESTGVVDLAVTVPTCLALVAISMLSAMESATCMRAMPDGRAEVGIRTIEPSTAPVRGTVLTVDVVMVASVAVKGESCCVREGRRWRIERYVTMHPFVRERRVSRCQRNTCRKNGDSGHDRRSYKPNMFHSFLLGLTVSGQLVISHEAVLALMAVPVRSTLHTPIGICGAGGRSVDVGAVKPAASPESWAVLSVDVVELTRLAETRPRSGVAHDGLRSADCLDRRNHQNSSEQRSDHNHDELRSTLSPRGEPLGPHSRSGV